MRLIDAEELERLFNGQIEQGVGVIGAFDAFYDALQDTPTVDDVEVVRCNDCKHYKPDEYECGCDFAGGLPYVKADDFCSCGERRNHD